MPGATGWPALGCDLLAQSEGDVFSLLLSVPGDWDAERIRKLPGGATFEKLMWIGSHAARFSLPNQ
jgi:hypothetical protein